MNLNRFCYLLLLLAAATSAALPHPPATWAGVVSLLTLVIYGADKLAARQGWRRVPEATLLVFGLLGGWPGAILGQRLFRHKTQKQPFRTRFALSVALNLTAVLTAGYWLYFR